MAKIGAHISIAGGIYKSPQRAYEIGAQCMQIFGSSPRQWKVKFPSLKDIKKFKQARKKYKINPVFLHAPYLINIGSNQKNIYYQSIKSLSDHLKIVSLLDAQGLIFHLGSSKGTTLNQAIKKSVFAIQKILKKVPQAELIIENNSGEGKKMGSTPQEIGIILKKVNSPRLKVCLDTAHALESGIINRYSSQKIKKFLNLWEKEIGANKTVVLHINDSKTPPGSRHDRHENIGKGYIGISGFKNLSQEKKVNKLPWILEVPGFEQKGPDKKNIEILKKLF